TGFFGAHLVAELLAEGRHVACLVRGRDAHDARRRVEQTMASLGLARTTDRARLECFAGDVSAPSLGLERSDWDVLIGRAERVYHAAAQVNFIYPYRVLRPANVLAVIEVLRFASAAGSCPVHHISTLGVTDAADEQELTIDETTPLEALERLD